MEARKFPWPIPTKWGVKALFSDYDKVLLVVEAGGATPKEPSYTLSIKQEGRDSPVAIEVESVGSLARVSTSSVVKRDSLNPSSAGVTRRKTVPELLMEAQKLLVEQGALEGTPTLEVYLP